MHPAMNRLLLLLMLAGVIALVTTASGLTISPICIAPGSQMWPAIDGDHVVWQDERNGYPDIYMYDIGTGMETEICKQPYFQVSPKISGDRIVWADMRTYKGNFDIYLYDISTGYVTQITTNSSDQQMPAISGDRVVWMDERNGGYSNRDIYLYDLTTGTETVICNATGVQQFPAIDGDHVVWEDQRNGGGYYPDIYMYDIATNEETKIGTGGYSPAISGEHVVWLDPRPGFWYINMSDLSTGTEKGISGASKEKNNVAIDGNRVVWADRETLSSLFHIHMYNLVTGSESPIISDTTQQQYPAISGNRIVFVQGSDIYMAELDPEPPIADAGGPYDALVGLPLLLDGSGSSDPDGSIVSYDWDFGDGSDGTGATPSHAFSSAGEVIVWLTVTDDDGFTGSDSATVTVKTPFEATEDLITQVEDLGLPIGTEGALTAKLEAAIEALDRGKEKTAINNLNLFISQVEALRGKKLDTADADALIAEAQKIIAAI